MTVSVSSRVQNPPGELPNVCGWEGGGGGEGESVMSQ